MPVQPSLPVELGPELPRRRKVRLPIASSDQATTQTMVALRAVGQPVTRDQCPTERPCPWYGCRHHLWAVKDIQGRRHHRDPSEANGRGRVRRHSEATCALDIAEANPDGINRRTVGAMLGITRERVRQIEGVAVERMRMAVQMEHHKTGDCADGCVWCVDQAEREHDATERATLSGALPGVA